MTGVVSAVAIYSLVGVGLAALLREQVTTEVGLLVYLFVVEPIVTRIPLPWRAGRSTCPARRPTRLPESP